jgi:hypothetical protein
MFALVELMTGFVFVTLAVILYTNIDILNGETIVPIVFGSIGACALIAAPMLFIIAKKQEAKNPSAVEY